jgi:hypothetical protein
MTVWQPAASDVSGIQRLAVLQFKGEGTSGDVARSALVSMFWNTSFYTLVDPSQANGGPRAGATVPPLTWMKPLPSGAAWGPMRC